MALRLRLGLGLWLAWGLRYDFILQKYGAIP